MSELDIYVESRSHFLASEFYVLGMTLERLKKAKVKIRVLERLDPADTGPRAFIHVDLTTVPPPYTWVHIFYERSINGLAWTISRDLYSKAKVTQSSDYSGPVILKTVLNHRGLPEFRYAKLSGSLKRARFGRSQLSDKDLETAFCPVYQVFDSPAEVPQDAWSNQSLMVERFLPGNLELPVVKYRHEFFLDLELNTRTRFDSLLCHPRTVTELEFIEAAPQEVHDVRRQLHLDFGAIDYFVIDEEVFVIDANKTSTFTRSWIREHAPLTEYLDDVVERIIHFARD